MTERLLQFIWQHQYYQQSELTTFSGLSLQILSRGLYNTNQGPDFLNARVMIGPIQLAGTIELHINTSDWNLHGHDNDKNYNNVILHVVWEHDTNDKGDGILELKGRVSRQLLNRYAELMNHEQRIPCSSFIASVPELIINNWMERMMIERLLQKKEKIDQLLEQTNHHWEEVFWRLVARNFGLPINADAFEAIAGTISQTLLAKHKHSIHQLEALLLGQANLLNETYEDAYVILLQREYRFLRKKYKLKPVYEPIHFLRMRPSNFPTIRLAQLAILIQQSNHLFSKVLECNELKDVKELLQVTANDFWHTHYTLTEASAFKKKQLGAMMTGSILINTIIPVVFVYGNYHNNDLLRQKALKWLQQLSKEENKITALWGSAGLSNRHSFDSQALLHLYKSYCSESKCLSCAIGNHILKKETTS